MSNHTACITHLIYFSKTFNSSTTIHKHNIQVLSSFPPLFSPIIPRREKQKLRSVQVQTAKERHYHQSSPFQTLSLSLKSDKVQ
jgi:hypothetical protein